MLVCSCVRKNLEMEFRKHQEKTLPLFVDNEFSRFTCYKILFKDAIID